MADQSTEPPVHERPKPNDKAPVYKVAVIQMHPKVAKDEGLLVDSIC